MELNPEAILQEITATAKKLDSDERSEIMRKIVRLRLLQDNPQLALQTIKQHSQGYDVPWTYLDITAYLAQTNQPVSDMTHLSINSPYYKKIEPPSKSFLLTHLARSLGNQYQDEQLSLLNNARGLLETSDKSTWYPNLIEGYATCGFFDQALELLPKIGSESEMWTSIIQPLIRAGQFDQALELTQRSKSTVRMAQASTAVAVEAARKKDTHTPSRIKFALKQIKKYEISI